MVFFYLLKYIVIKFTVVFVFYLHIQPLRSFLFLYDFSKKKMIQKSKLHHHSSNNKLRTNFRQWKSITIKYTYYIEYEINSKNELKLQQKLAHLQ